ncbi:MAG: response regulator transcription factor [Egibacteraceae bacterium]
MPTSETVTAHARKSTTVVVVDDHHAIRSALCMMLDGLPDVAVVGQGASVVQAGQVIEAQDPDVVLLDLRLHGEDGLEVARALRDRAARTKVLVLSASDGLDDLRAALDAGANGFLSKSAPMPVLVDGVRRTAAGQQVISAELVYALSGRVAAPAATPRRSSRHRRQPSG